MLKPIVICHMVQSIDGKVTGDFLSAPASQTATDVYYQINRDTKAQAFACGRVTMEGSFTGGYVPDLTPYTHVSIPKTDHVACTNAQHYAVSFDRLGRVGWTTSQIVDDDPGYGGAHIIEVLTETEQVQEAYLAYLQDIGVSYIFAGQGDMDLALALHKLYILFGIETLLLEGGSIINGAFLRAGLVDEVSLVVAPVVADKQDAPLFDQSTLTNFALTACETTQGVVVLRYKKEV